MFERPLAARAMGLAAVAAGLAGLVWITGGLGSDPVMVVGSRTFQAPEFDRPFVYEIPDGMVLQVVEANQKLYLLANDIVLGQDGQSLPYAQQDDGGIKSGIHGISIATSSGLYVHPCPLVNGGRSRIEVGATPDGFLAGLRTIGGMGLVAGAPFILDGRPATPVELDRTMQRCDTADFHMDGATGTDYVLLIMPSRLILTVVDERMVVIHIWAATDAELEAWLPAAMRVVGSIHFTGP